MGIDVVRIELECRAKLADMQRANPNAKLPEAEVQKMMWRIVQKKAWKLLVRHIDEPVPEDVDAAANPPAEYWERRWDEPVDAARARLGIRPSHAW